MPNSLNSIDTNISICSHTLVRDGMPFIAAVIRQVIPLMNRCLITVSEKSKDGTLSALRSLEKEYPDKIRISFENVTLPGLLTAERQKQVDQTYEDWILFLDDDDYWPSESLTEILPMLSDPTIDALAPSPIQVIDNNYYDKHWYEHKFFTKWFRNKDIHYVHPWPHDLIHSGEDDLYWKHNSRTRRLYGKYFHLSAVKNSSFRGEAWTKGKFAEPIKNRSTYPEWCLPHLERIYDLKRRNQ